MMIWDCNKKGQHKKQLVSTNNLSQLHKHLCVIQVSYTTWDVQNQQMYTYHIMGTQMQTSSGGRISTHHQ